MELAHHVSSSIVEASQLTDSRYANASVIHLLPRHIIFMTSRFSVSLTHNADNVGDKCDTKHNTMDDKYVRKEYELVAGRYLSLKKRKKDLAAFIKERQELSAKMMQVWPL